MSKTLKLSQGYKLLTNGKGEYALVNAQRLILAQGNKTFAEIVNILQVGATKEAIAVELMLRYDAPIEQVKSDIDRAVLALKKVGVLQEEEQTIQRQPIIVNLKCSNCGATLEVSNDRSVIFCQYCGAKQMIIR